jgi:uncharacterized membrane protein YkvA (DUF1232 family)
MVLFDMLEPLSNRLEGLSDEEDGPAFAALLLKCRPEAFGELVGGAQSSEARLAAHAIAGLCLAELRQVPEIVDYLCRKMSDSSLSPSLRSTMAFALAYLAAPIDLLPDDLPGGFGYVDDAIMLWGLVGALYESQRERRDRFRTAVEAIRTLSMSLPRNVAELLENTALGAIAVVNALNRYVPESDLLRLTRNYIDYPAEMIMEAVVDVVQPPPSLPQPSETFFCLPDGSVWMSANGMLAYRFDGGEIIALG